MMVYSPVSGPLGRSDGLEWARPSLLASEEAKSGMEDSKSVDAKT